jgi:hypothetical protein
VTVNQSGPAVHTNTILSFALKKNRTWMDLDMTGEEEEEEGSFSLL